MIAANISISSRPTISMLQACLRSISSVRAWAAAGVQKVIAVVEAGALLRRQLLLGTLREIAAGTANIRQMQSLEQGARSVLGAARRNVKTICRLAAPT
jgi:hypothetical protein